MMQRSNRFISLSGFSGIAAGLCALAGAYFAYDWIAEYNAGYQAQGFQEPSFQRLKWNLTLLAGAVLATALVSAFYFTWRRASKANTPLWDHSTRLLLGSMLVPLLSGGLLIGLLILQTNEWRLLAPLSLIFYGLALVSGSKYTLSDIRYLGFLEILVGLVSTQFTGYGLYFWALGFGVLHIIYGALMWWKYERNSEAANLAH